MKNGKLYTPKEVGVALIKSLHRAIAKADPGLKAILADLEDDNAQKEVPSDAIQSAAPESVLYKAPQQGPKPPSLSQSNPVGKGPKNFVPPNIGQMALNKQPKAPSLKPKMGISLPKSEDSQDQSNLKRMRKLKEFLDRRAQKANPDLKQDAALGEEVERAVEQHESEVPSHEHQIPMAKEEKGVHAPAFMHSKKSGTSDVGARLSPGGNTKQTMDYAKNVHKQVLSDLKSMPKPNLPKSEEADMAKEEKGVHLPHLADYDGGSKKGGQSIAGDQSRMMSATKNNKGDMTRSSYRHKDNAMDSHKQVLSDLKAIPKPNLTKSEYSPREAAIEVLKKAESILKAKKLEWDEQKVEKNKMVDPSLMEERQVANQNDIDQEYQQELIDTSKERLNKFLAKRKAKKIKDQ